MNFLALLLGLALERGLTHLLHLREFRWLDPLFDAYLRRVPAAPGSAIRRLTMIAYTVLFAAVLVAPVALLSVALREQLLQIPYFLFAVFVLLFSLGPRDLDDEVENYADALESGNVEKEQRIATILLERAPPAAMPERAVAIEGAIYVQANNRLFGVIFWFLALGPTGAWAFRVIDLMRHHARLRTALHGVDADRTAVEWLHALLGFIPSRLLALGYVLAGNFEAAISTWRQRGREVEASLAEGTSIVLARVGKAAAGRDDPADADISAALNLIRGARALVMRTLWMIWCPTIAVLTLYEWLV